MSHVYYDLDIVFFLRMLNNSNIICFWVIIWRVNSDIKSSSTCLMPLYWHAQRRFSAIWRPFLTLFMGHFPFFLCLEMKYRPFFFPYSVKKSLFFPSLFFSLSFLIMKRLISFFIGSWDGSLIPRELEDVYKLQRLSLRERYGTIYCTGPFGSVAPASFGWAGIMWPGGRKSSWLGRVRG